MFCDETAPFKDDMLKLDHYLGSSVDVGLLMENGQVLHRSTHWSLTPDELLNKDGSEAQEQFMARVYYRLNSQVISRELEDLRLENTPQYDPYENKMQNKQSFPQLVKELEPAP